MGTARRTPLHDRHAALGARFAPFAGWEMPIRYGEVRDEHLAVRSSVGVFDVSHMGQLHVSGDGALPLLRSAITNDSQTLAPGEAQYTLMLSDDGGAIDDLIAYRLDDGYLLVVNASNRDACRDRLNELAGRAVVVEDRSDETAMLAVQGPLWRESLAGLVDAAALGMAAFTHAGLRVGGVDCLVARTGYTGEPGVEIMCAAGDAPALWDALMAGPLPPTPAGLGARDTLRTEMGYPLYGQELSRDRTPIEAGLAWACDLASGTFAGVETLRAQREEGTAERLVAFAMVDDGIPRPGCAVCVGDAVVGAVTSGTLSPTLGIGIGLAYIDRAHAEIGTEVEIEIRGNRRRAQVRRRPLVDTSPRKGD